MNSCSNISPAGQVSIKRDGVQSRKIPREALKVAKVVNQTNLGVPCLANAPESFIKKTAHEHLLMTTGVSGKTILSHSRCTKYLYPMAASAAAVAIIWFAVFAGNNYFFSHVTAVPQSEWNWISKVSGLAIVSGVLFCGWNAIKMDEISP